MHLIDTRTPGTNGRAHIPVRRSSETAIRASCTTPTSRSCDARSAARCAS